MRFRTIFGIHREGWFLLVPLLAVGYLFVQQTSWWAALPIGLLVLAVGVVFYEPKSTLSSNPLGVVAPVDGSVIEIGPAQDPYLGRKALRVRLLVRTFGGYYLRAAIEGKLQSIKSQPKVDCSQASWIQSDEHDDVVVAVERGSLFGLKPCAGCLGERVGQGRKCGLRRAARVIDVYMPESVRMHAKEGDAVAAGETVLATLVHAPGQVNQSHAIGEQAARPDEAEAATPAA